MDIVRRKKRSLGKQGVAERIGTFYKEGGCEGVDMLLTLR
jgi:hypothetical protein